MKKEIKLKKILMTTCIAVLVLFAVTIAVRVFTRQVLILHFGMDNAFTSFIFFDDENMTRPADYQATVYGDTDDYSINWSEAYPFEHADDIEEKEVEDNSFVTKYTSVVSSVEKSIERYTQDNLVGYKFLTGLANKYENMVGWNFTSYNEYNGIYKLSDGYWTALKEEKDISDHVTALVSLNEFCEENGQEFLYIQAPYKISKYEDEGISGVVDFSNQNADDLLKGLEDAEVDTLDLRTIIYDEGLSHHELFYRTDHHWKGETGLWAAEKISEFLNSDYGYNIDTELLNDENFYSVEYPEYFLGSLGKKVTLAQTSPDDFALLYPKYDTELHYLIPSINIDKTGDFSITYNMEAVDGIDYYNKDPYHAYNYGDRAIIQIENLKEIEEDKKILIVHDSFSDCVISFLALGTKNVEAIDLRYFTGSLESYIKESNPDMVIVMYNAGEVSYDIDLTTHTNLFDFR